MCNIGKISRNKSYQWAVKKSQGRSYETSWNIFCNSFKVIGVYKSPKNIELYTIQGIICHPGAISRNKSDQWPWKSTKDVLMRRPATHFATVLNWLVSTILPKTLNYIQYRLLCVTQATYRAIKVIYEPWKSPKDVLMRRPATYFATYFNWLASSNLPKTLNYMQ